MSKKIKVLWFCNVSFSDAKSSSTGSWLFPMVDSLLETNEIEFYNITQGKVSNVTSQDYGYVNQWLVPYSPLRSNGLPAQKTVDQIRQIVEEINPDIIHIWGTENYWGLLYSRGYIKGNVILEMQGLKYACAKYFYVGLSFYDILKCFRLKEFIKPSRSLPGIKAGFEKWGRFEKEMLLKANFISTQSDWVRAHVSYVNDKANLIKTKITLRKEFLKADKWNAEECVPYTIFTSASSSSVSYKGLHILFDAVAILKKRFPEIRLNIAGSVSSGLREDGYSKWLKEKAKKNGIIENISWLGSLDAGEIVMQMRKSNVVVIPSFVESYCLALDEALTVGVPSVVSFAAALPELATHEETALFYPSGDVEMCANAIERYFNDIDLARLISKRAYEEKQSKDNREIALLQMDIYKKVLGINL